jgi:hypothetical protein
MKNYLLVVLMGMPGMAMAQQAPPPLPRTQLEVQLKANFNRADGNKDGFVTRAESAAARESALGARFDAMFNALDTDKNGSISRTEFVAANRRAVTNATGGNGLVDREFAVADTNKDGRVALSEALAIPLRQFDGADSNHDGVLSPAEQIAAAKRQRAQRR